MSDNLKDAAESGFRIYGEKIQAPFSNEDLTGVLEAYTSRILASQQAAHEAEIARLKEEMVEWERNQLEPIKHILREWREDHISDSQLAEFIDQFTKG